jgi:hypothetical protein
MMQPQYRKMISCLQLLPCPTYENGPNWILLPCHGEQSDCPETEKEALQHALVTVGIHRHMAARDIPFIAALMQMAYNASHNELEHRPLRIDSNLTRAKVRVFKQKLPIAAYSQCPNEYCKTLESNLKQPFCQNCSNTLLTTSGSPRELFSLMPLAASLQLLLEDPVIKQYIVNPSPIETGALKCW